MCSSSLEQKKYRRGDEQKWNLKIALDTTQRNRQRHDKEVNEKMKEEPVSGRKHRTLDPLCHSHCIDKIGKCSIDLNVCKRIDGIPVPQFPYVRCIKLLNGQRFVGLRS